MENVSQNTKIVEKNITISNKKSTEIILENKSTVNAKSKKKKTKRCQMEGCNKKLTICPIVCKCKKSYCNIHLHSEKHNCTFDYKLESRKHLNKQNPKIEFSKFEKI